MRKLFFSFLLALVVPMVAGAQEAYAVYDGEETFTFYYDSDRASRSGESYDLTPAEYGRPQWYEADWKGNVTKAVFDASFADARPTTTRYWVGGFSNMTEIEGIEYLNTSEVTGMSGMFDGCSGLTSLDLSNFKTDNVTSMSNMFDGCSGLTSLDVSNFKTDNVTSMETMFAGCSGLTSLDVTGFKTDNVTSMETMFYQCSGLTSLDMSNFKTDNVTSMYAMFSQCFGLTSLDVSNFKTDNVTDMGGMFCGCSGLTSLDVTGFKTDNVTDMSQMFAFCSGLATIYCNDDWKARGLNSDYMFYYCTSLVGGAGTVFDTTKTDATMAHPDVASNPGYFTRKDGSVSEGDLTHDGVLDAADVVVLVGLIMNGDPEGDLNGDGKVDVADVLMLVNHIIGKKSE